MTDKIIPLTEYWRLRIERMNVVLERKQTIKPKDKAERIDWVFTGYYGSISKAVGAIPEHISFTQDYKTLGELNDLISELADELQAQLADINIAKTAQDNAA